MTVRVEVAIEADGEVLHAMATTLGAGGLFVASDDPLEEATPLLARFRLARESTPHALRGRVVWAQRKDDLPRGTPGMGIAFEDPAAGAVLAAELEAFELAEERL